MENERHVNVFARIPGAVALVVAITSVASADIIIDRTTITTVASGQSTTRAASNVLDGDLGLAGSPDNTMWVTPNQSTWEAVALQWIKFDLGAEYELSTIKVWNYNEGSAANWLKRGLKQADIQYAATQADYLNNNFTTITGLADVFFAQAKGYPYQTAADYTLITLPANFTARYIRFDVDLNWSLSTDISARWAVGLSEVEFAQVASIPEPASMGVLGLAAAGLLLRRR